LVGLRGGRASCDDMLHADVLCSAWDMPGEWLAEQCFAALAFLFDSALAG